MITIEAAIHFQKVMQGSSCKLCNYMAPTVAALRMHMKKHKRCRHCDYISRNVPDIKKHSREVHNQDYEVTIYFLPRKGFASKLMVLCRFPKILNTTFPQL
jgi:hypothetical protein